MKLPRRKIGLPKKREQEPSVVCDDDGVPVFENKTLAPLEKDNSGNHLATPIRVGALKKGDVVIYNNVIYCAEYDADTVHTETVSLVCMRLGNMAYTDVITFDVGDTVLKVDLENLMKVVNGDMALPDRSSRTLSHAELRRMTKAQLIDVICSEGIGGPLPPPPSPPSGGYIDYGGPIISMNAEYVISREQSEEIARYLQREALTRARRRNRA